MRLRILAGFILTAALLVGPEHAAFGASFTVDATVDAVDANPGDGVCADATGACTLRAAIQETNALPGADTIALDFATYTLTIAGTGEDAGATGDLDITDDLSMGGGTVVNGAPQPGSVIDGGGLDRVLHIVGDVTVNMTGVVIQNGDVTPVTGSGGGILNPSGTIALTNSVVRDNKASGVGGIGNSGIMMLTNVSVTGNTRGGISSGGLGRPATLTLLGSNVSGNVGGGYLQRRRRLVDRGDQHYRWQFGGRCDT